MPRSIDAPGANRIFMQQVVRRLVEVEGFVLVQEYGLVVVCGHSLVNST